MHITVVKSNTKDAESLTSRLARYGHDVALLHTGTDILSTYHRAELILLDLELPDIDGFEVCRQIRHSSQIPIITFTTQGDPINRTLSLQAGSDDCIEEPHYFHELVARIDAVMRRIHKGEVKDPALTQLQVEEISIGDIHINPATRKIYVNDLEVKLTRKEFDLLAHLARNPDSVVTRQELMLEVWNYKSAHSANARASRTIDTHVNSLRNKIGHEYIDTVHGIGFRISGVRGRRKCEPNGSSVPHQASRQESRL